MQTEQYLMRVQLYNCCCNDTAVVTCFIKINEYLKAQNKLIKKCKLEEILLKDIISEILTARGINVQKYRIKVLRESV